MFLKHLAQYKMITILCTFSTDDPHRFFFEVGNPSRPHADASCSPPLPSSPFGCESSIDGSHGLKCFGFKGGLSGEKWKTSSRPALVAGSEWQKPLLCTLPIFHVLSITETLQIS